MIGHVRCACGELLAGETGELLLAAVERHAAEAHPEEAWRWGPTWSDLRQQVAGLGRRVASIERALGDGERR